jgi:hypothetical protein
MLGKLLPEKQPDPSVCVAPLRSEPKPGCTTTCPGCGRKIPLLPEEVNTVFECSGCGTRFVPSTGQRVAAQPRVPASDGRSANEKYCHECGAVIRAKAVICPKCGVPQPTIETGASPSRPSRTGIKVPLLVSAIANIVVGLVWVSTCFGFVFTVPMTILCVFEFGLWAKADSLPVSDLAGRAKTIGIFEIIVGLANIVTLICGIILLINCSKVEDPTW